jgi:hypothetical protein
MAKTTARTQQMIGLLLDELDHYIANFEFYVENRADRLPGSIVDDEDFNKAAKIIQNLIQRQIMANENRVKGAELETAFWL